MSAENRPQICIVIDRQLNNGVLTPKELADGMGVTESTVSRWRHYSIPASGKWRKLAQMLLVDVKELLQGSHTGPLPSYPEGPPASMHSEGSPAYPLKEENRNDVQELREKYIGALEANAELHMRLYREREINRELREKLLGMDYKKIPG